MDPLELPSDVSDVELPPDVDLTDDERPVETRPAKKARTSSEHLPELPGGIVLTSTRKAMMDSIPCQPSAPDWLRKRIAELPSTSAEQHDFMEAHLAFRADFITSSTMLTDLAQNTMHGLLRARGWLATTGTRPSARKLSYPDAAFGGASN